MDRAASRQDPETNRGQTLLEEPFQLIGGAPTADLVESFQIKQWKQEIQDLYRAYGFQASRTLVCTTILLQLSK